MAKQYPTVKKGKETGRLNREEVRKAVIAVRDERLAAAKRTKAASRKAAGAAQPARVRVRKSTVRE